MSHKLLLVYVATCAPAVIVIIRHNVLCVLYYIINFIICTSYISKTNRFLCIHYNAATLAC